jgi:DNA repair exonuclease SbcCD ATPase subunit
MASEKIKHSDLIEDKVFDPTIKNGEEMLVVIGKLKHGFEDMLQVSQQFLKQTGLPNTTKGLVDLEKNLKSVSNAEKALAEIEKQKIKIENELIKVQKEKSIAETARLKAVQEQIKTEALYNKEIEKTAKAEAKKAKEQEKANSEYAIAVKRLSEVKKELKDLSIQGVTSGDAVEGLRKEFDILDKSVRKAEEDVGEFQRNVGNYPKQLKEMQRALQGLEPGTKEFIKLSKEAGELKDKINDAKDATKAFASGSKTQTAKTLFGQIGSDLKDLDFAGAADKAKQFASVVSSISFSEVLSGIKGFGSALIDIGKGLLLNPFVLVATAIAGIGVAISGFIDSMDAGTKALKENDKALRSVIDSTNELKKANRDLALQNDIDAGRIDKISGEKLKNQNKFKDDYVKILQEQRAAVEKFNADIEAEREDDGFKATKKLYELLGGETNVTRRQKIGLLDIEETFAKKKEELRIRFGLENTKILEQQAREEKKLEEDKQETILKQQEKKQELLKKENDFAKELRAAETANILNNYDRQRAELTQKFNDDFEAYKTNKALIAELTVKLERDLKAIDEKEKADNLEREKKHLEELKKLREAQGEYEKKKADELNKLREAQGEYEEKLRKEEAEAAKKRREQEIQDNYKTIETINKAVAEGLQKRSQAKQDQLNKELDENEKAINRQEELAAKGLENQLAFEEAKKAELALKLKQEKEKERKQEEAAQLASAFLEFLKERSKENPNTAPARALSDVLIAKAIGKTISGLYEGADEVKPEHAVGVLPQAKDNLLVPLHKGERVFGVDDSKKVKGMTNKELVRAGELYKQGFFMPEIQDVSKAKQVDNALALMLSKKITELNNTIKNKPEYRVYWDTHGARVEEIVEGGMRKVTRKIATGKPRI